jgi:hypothetical protein
MKLTVSMLVLAGVIAAGCSGNHQSRPVTTSEFLIDVSLSDAKDAALRFERMTAHRRPISADCTYEIGREPSCIIQLRKGCDVVQLYRRGGQLLARRAV